MVMANEMIDPAERDTVSRIRYGKYKSCINLDGKPYFLMTKEDGKDIWYCPN